MLFGELLNRFSRNLVLCGYDAIILSHVIRYYVTAAVYINGDDEDVNVILQFSGSYELFINYSLQISLKFLYASQSSFILLSIWYGSTFRCIFLWSSGQTSWLQTQRSRVRFSALPDFLSSGGSGTGSTQPL
jgi:hypothetical protein